MRNLLKICLISVFFSCTLNISSVFAEDKTVTINSVGTSSLDTAKAQVVIEGSGNLEVKDFKVAKPPMIVLDIANALSKVNTKNIKVNTGVIKAIRSSQFKVKPQPSVRVVIDLKEKANYEISKEENKIVVIIEQPGTEEKVEKVEPKAEETKEVAAPKEEEVVAAPLVETPVPAAATAPETDPQVEKKEDVKEKEQTISLDFKNADIRDVLKILSIKSGINMVYGDDVKGEITVHLDKVSFQDGLNIILRLTGLTYDYIAPNVMRIATPSKVKEEQGQGVTQTGIFGVNYAKAADLTSILTPLLSGQGKIQTDSRTNSVIVTDIPDNIKKVVDMLKILDVPTPQVMIEAQIVSINKDASKDIGISWSATKTWTGLGGTPKQDFSGGGANIQGEQGGVNTSAATGVALGGGLINIGKIVNKGGEWTNLQATLNALETKGKGKVLSSPKIATLNNQEASIMSGKKVAYTSSTSQSAGGTVTTNVNFIDVGIKLTVTPSINLDKKITMKMHAEVSSIGNVPPNTSVPPPISTRSADTNILASDGETLVIGGLIDEQATEDLSRIPFVGEIPIIGALFTHKSNTSTKTELLVFITPHVM